MSQANESPGVLTAHTQTQALLTRLRAAPETLLVACYCAAWCDTCKQYDAPYAALAQRMPEHVFAWIDIEESPALLDDTDIANFPTLLLQRGEQTLFFGPLQPFIHHLEGLLLRVDQLKPMAGPASLADLLASDNA